MSACILWEGSHNGAGYGERRIAGRKVYVHRLSYCEHRGLCLEDIEGEVIRHTCDTPACYNPLHLVRGSQQQNTDVDRKRDGKVYWKLTQQQADAIRAQPSRSRKELANEYGVSVATIKDIRAGRSWV